GNYSTTLTASAVNYQGQDDAAPARLVAEARGASAADAPQDVDAGITGVVRSGIADRGPEPGDGAGSEETGAANGGAASASTRVRGRDFLSVWSDSFSSVPAVNRAKSQR